MADIIKLLLSGTPTTLLENALELADDMKFAVMVFVTKDGQIKTLWKYCALHLLMPRWENNNDNLQI
jgi:hypothetical protein